MKQTTGITLGLALGGVFAFGSALADGGNPFTTVEHGPLQVAAAGEAQCGEAKCGGNKKPTPATDMPSTPEAKCGANTGDKGEPAPGEAKCGANK